MNAPIVDFESYVNFMLLSQTYKVAASMPKFPHAYTLRTNWINDSDFVRVVEFMRQYGRVEYFFKKPYIMYDLNGFKYWTMGFPIYMTKLINRAAL
ncbi:MAG: hypothetical protein ACOYMF_06215 [Bacteroidales bacterium]